MSDFHRRLIEARRAGTAPGQVSDTPPAAPMPEFLPIPAGVPLTFCTRCYGVVPADRTSGHTEWHANP